MAQLSQYENKQIRMVVCGGDGTLHWVINEMINYKLNLSKIVLGVLPIGTGNDFSRSIGWGYQSISFSKGNTKELDKLVLRWIKAHVGNYDIWEVMLETFDDGCFYDIKSQVQTKISKKVISKHFTNYVGIGLDARVVYSVQQRRTNSAFWNKVVYACVGFCNCFKKMKHLNETVDRFQQSSQSQSQSQSNNQQSKQSLQFIKKQVQSKNISQTFEENLNGKQTYIPIKRGYRGLVCLNCPSYMCGLTNVWATRKIGHKLKNRKKFQTQKYDDGIVQFVGYKTQLNLALQRVMRSGAKIAQGSGPFEITMKQLKSGQKEITFMQIDGESLKVQNLKKITICKNKNIQNSKLKVMISNQ